MGIPICVFCASSNNASPRYLEVARTLGGLMVERGHTLIYGGGSVGLMGELAREVQQGGGRVVGVIPERLSTEEIAFEAAEELLVTADMAERKNIMIERAEAFICLPGAFGTLDEMLEIMRNDKLRNYQIDVETDSTVFADEEEVKRTRIEFANVFGNYLVKAIEATRAAPEVTPIAFEILKFVAGAWKIGRNFEDVIDQTEATVMQQLQAMQQQPQQPSPEERIQQQKIMAELEREKLKQEGKLADISSRERSKAAEIQEDAMICIYIYTYHCISLFSP